MSLAGVELPSCSFQHQIADVVSAGKVRSPDARQKGCMQGAGPGEREAAQGQVHRRSAGCMHRAHIARTGQPGASLPSHPLERHRQISDAQLQTVLYASAAFHGPRLKDGARHGFFLGDGAGVGKGRQIAALVRQHSQEGGRRALWLSVSTDLRKDAERGAGAPPAGLQRALGGLEAEQGMIWGAEQALSSSCALFARLLTPPHPWPAPYPSSSHRPV